MLIFVGIINQKLPLNIYGQADNWRPSSLSELTQIEFNNELTLLGSLASKYHY